MSKKQWILPLGIIAILFAILVNPFPNLAKDSESVTYTTNELIPYIEKYRSLIFRIDEQLCDNGYPSVIDYAMLTNEKIEILIRLAEVNDMKKSEDIIQIVNTMIEKEKFDPTMFQINISKLSEPTLNSENRLSYYDLMGYILLAMGEKDFGGFSLDYKILPETTEITIKLADLINETQKTEIQEIVNHVLKQNDFDPSMFQVNISNYK